jgi:hypothetical protein
MKSQMLYGFLSDLFHIGKTSGTVNTNGIEFRYY